MSPVCLVFYLPIFLRSLLVLYDFYFLLRQHQFAIRATLLSTEALKSRNVYLDSALQFMRMTAEVRKEKLLTVTGKVFPVNTSLSLKAARCFVTLLIFVDRTWKRCLLQEELTSDYSPNF